MAIGEQSWPQPASATWRRLGSEAWLLGARLAIASGLVSLIGYPAILDLLLRQAGAWSPDQHLQLATKLLLATAVAYLGLLATNGGGLAILATRPHHRRRIVQSVIGDIPGRWQWIWLVLCTVIPLLLVVSWVVARFVQWYPLVLLYPEDSLFENLTAGFCLAAAVLLGWAWWRTRRRAIAESTLRLRWDLWATAGVAVVAFFVGMEEISWGQRLLGWATPTAWAQLNIQGETTLHNLVPIHLAGVYQVLILPTAGVLASLWWQIFEPDVSARHPALPHPALLPGAILMGLVTLTYEHELLEELTGIWLLLYAIGVIIGVRQRDAQASVHCVRHFAPDS